MGVMGLPQGESVQGTLAHQTDWTYLCVHLRLTLPNARFQFRWQLAREALSH